MTLNRRNFIKVTGLLAASPVAKAQLSTQSQKPRIVVVGGGFGGASCAKYLKHWGGDDLNVTLIDPKPHHTSCVLSNLILNGRISLQELRLGFDDLQAKYGVNLHRGKVQSVDANNRQLTLKDGSSERYDMLVLATGIGFKRPRGWNASAMPHAWIAGGQTNQLKKKLNAMAAGDTFVMTIARSPYRCPPGPYERACLVADMLKRKGGGRVLVLDANDNIQAERHTFSRAFSELYGNIIEYYPQTELHAIDGDVLQTSMGDIVGDVVNILPTQRATSLVRTTGLTGSKNWADVDVTTYESTLSGFEDIHIIGDSQGSGQPKSAHMANAQAKVCADAIIRKLSSQATDSQQRLENLTTNSACYSPISYDSASWLTAVFNYDMDAKQMKLSHLGEAENWSREAYRDMFDWSANLFKDSFS